MTWTLAIAIVGVFFSLDYFRLVAKEERDPSIPYWGLLVLQIVCFGLFVLGVKVIGLFVEWLE